MRQCRLGLVHWASCRMLAFGMPVEVTFNAFVAPLATTAAVHFGDVAGPSSGAKPPANIDAAVHAIEMLSLLNEKTKGNLTEDEKSFLVNVLLELRMRLVEVRKATATSG